MEQCSYQVCYTSMSLIKSRNWTQKEDEDLLAVLQELDGRQVEATWNQISELIKQRNPASRKTGKQCRERWANQLDPKIKRNQNWTDEQNDRLFQLHSELGNKWSQICSHLTGRTDNCVKNHYYSTMRRGMRKINSYIENVKRKSALSKTFKNQILNKILAICEGKNDNKYQFNSTAKTLALSIKTGLIKLSLHLSDVDDSDILFKETLFEEISEFSRNCRKRKIKKNSDLSSPSLNEQKLNEPVKVAQQPNSSFQLSRNKKKKQASRSGSSLIHAQQKRIENPNLQSQKIEKSLKQNPIRKINELKIQQQNLRQKQMKYYKIGQSNPFAYVYPNFSDLASLFNLNSRAEEQQPLPSIFNNPNKASGQINFESSRSVSTKQLNNLKKNESGVIIFPDLPSQFNEQGTNDKQGMFSEIIKSQQIQPGLPFPFMSQQNNIFNMFTAMTKNSEQNAGISLSAAYSPFNFCSPSPGFSFMGNVPPEEGCFSQKFQSTVFGFSNNSVDKDSQLEGGTRKSSFKLLKKISIDEKKSQEGQK